MSLTLKDITFIILISFFISCEKQAEFSASKSQYSIKINIDYFNEHTIYLYKLIPNFSVVDSALVIKNTTSFDGNINFPERFILTLDNIDGGKLFIIENDSIEITMDKNDLKKSTIIGSKINDELFQFQNESKQIAAKIELLFPDLQRARLNNDAEVLKNISKQIAEIEQENINFNFEYINQHPDSFIAAMILNDLSKRDEIDIDIDKISKAYHSLSNKVKQSVDAKEVHRFLSL